MPQTVLPFGRKAVIWTIRVVLGMMVFPALVVSVYAIVTLRQKHSEGVVSLVVLALVLWALFFALYLTGWLFEKRTGSRFVRYFADSPLSRNWFDIVDPSEALKLATVDIGKDSSVHASTISEVAIYGKDEGAAADSHPKNSEDGHKAPFIDNKIAFYLSYVNGGMNGK